MISRRTITLGFVLFGMTAVLFRVEQLRVEARTRHVTKLLATLSTEGPGFYYRPNAKIDPAVFQREGVSIRATDREGHSVLMYAARAGDPKLLDYALSQGLDVNAQDDGGLTALTYAAIANRPDLIQVLVKRGADPTGAENPSLTPLMDACLHGHLASISALLKLGALTPENYRESMALVEDRERLHQRILQREPRGSYMWRTAIQDAARSRTIRQMLEQHRPKGNVA